MTLDLVPFDKALVTLREALAEYDKDRSNNFVRDSCIQRFEYCYELSWRILKRHLEMVAESPTMIDVMAFPDLIRTACEKELLNSSWDVWSIFRKMRNETSHAYNAEKAVEVYSVIPAFLIESEALLAKLKERNA